MIENRDMDSGEQSQSRPELDNICERVKHDYGQEYAQARAGDIVEASLRLGLNHEFVPIFTQYLTDLHLIVVDRKRPATDGVLIDFRKLRKGSEIHWSRCLSIDDTDLSDRMNEINVILDLETTITEPADNGRIAKVLPLVKEILIDDEIKDAELPFRGVLLGSESPLLSENSARQLTPEASANLGKLMFLAIDWITLEQAAVVLSDAYYMRNTFGKYIPDINVHAYDKGQFAMSAAYLARYGKEKAPTVKEDLTNLRQGFGLVMLKNSLFQHDLVDKPQQAEWAIQQLSNSRPNAFSTDQIAEHIQCLKPRPDVLEGYAEFSDLFYDPKIDAEQSEDPQARESE